MAGQQNFLYLTQENYFDKFENDLLKYADLYYLNKIFGVGEDINIEKVRHAQMFYNILCTDECELIDWVWKKINGDLEGLEFELKLKDFKIYDIPFSQESCEKVTDSDTLLRLISLVGQNVFLFQSIAGDLGRQQGTISFDSFGGVGTNFSDIDKIKLSEKPISGYTIKDYLPTLVGDNIIISQVNNINNFGVYKVISMVKDSVETSFFNVVLEYIEGNGNLIADSYYELSLHSTEELEDKSFVFYQQVPSKIWVIEHNLNKHPSVTVVNINDVSMYGEVIYINDNKLEIHFSAGFSGRAYLN